VLGFFLASFDVDLFFQGRPFRESLTDNKPLWVSIRGVGSIVVISALQYLPFVNEILQLVPMPLLVSCKGNCGWVTKHLTT
jgi:hypothetical protein